MTNEQRGIDGMYRVGIYDDSFGCGCSSTIIDWVSKAVAKSIARHYNKIVCNIDSIFYYVEDREDMEQGLSHWI